MPVTEAMELAGHHAAFTPPQRSVLWPEAFALPWSTQEKIGQQWPF